MRSSFSDLTRQGLCGSMAHDSVCHGVKVVTYSLEWSPVNVLLQCNHPGELSLVFIKMFVIIPSFLRPHKMNKCSQRRLGKAPSRIPTEFLNFNANFNFPHSLWPLINFFLSVSPSVQ